MKRILWYVGDKKLWPGLIFTCLILSCMGFSAFGTDPWTPKIAQAALGYAQGDPENPSIIVNLCADPPPDLSTVAMWEEDLTKYAPGVNWVVVSASKRICESGGYAGYVGVIEEDVDDAYAKATLYFSRVDGWYRAADAGQGEPGWVQVGEVFGCRIKVGNLRKIPAVVKGHEANHCLGRWHTFMFPWMKHFGVYQNKHVLSPGMLTKGPDTRGLTRVPVMDYEIELIDHLGKMRPSE